MYVLKLYDKINPEKVRDALLYFFLLHGSFASILLYLYAISVYCTYRYRFVVRKLE